MLSAIILSLRRRAQIFGSWISIMSIVLKYRKSKNIISTQPPLAQESSGGFLSPKIFLCNPISNLFHFLPIILHKLVQFVVNGFLLLAVIAGCFPDDGGALFLLRFKYLHIGILYAHKCELTLELTDIGVVAVDQVAVNVLLSGFAQISVILQQLDVLTFLAAAVNSVRSMEIL